MLLDLNRLHGSHEHVERVFQPSVFDPPDEDYRVVEPVELSMDVMKAGRDAFRVTGRLKTRLELECGRCVELFRIPLAADFELQYVPATENTGDSEREIADDDLTVSFYRDGILDIGELLREQFQLALPMKPLCSDGCRGLCPECGANLNRTECGCAPKWEDPRLAPLKGLLNREKEN
jgi:uncharacterized protein